MSDVKVTGNAAQVRYLQVRVKLLLLYTVFTEKKRWDKRIKGANLEAAGPLVVFDEVVLVQDVGRGVHQVQPASLQQGV